MKQERDRYTLVITPTARRQLAQHLPEAVAFAAHEFIVGPLLDNPKRVGKRLQPPLDDRHSARRGTYRVIYRNQRRAAHCHGRRHRPPPRCLPHQPLIPSYPTGPIACRRRKPIG